MSKMFVSTTCEAEEKQTVEYTPPTFKEDLETYARELKCELKAVREMAKALPDKLPGDVEQNLRRMFHAAKAHDGDVYLT